MTAPTQHERIIEVMVNWSEKVWWYPPDFMRPGMENFVGYEASARLSELAKLYPDMIESRRTGKFMERRIRWENMKVWWETIPQSFRTIFRKHEKAPKRTVEFVGGVARVNY